MRDFQPLLVALQNEGFDSLLKEIGVKSWKLLLVDSSQNTDFSAKPPPSGSSFVILADPTELTTLKINQINTKVSRFLSKLKFLSTYPFELQTETAFKNEYGNLTKDQCFSTLSKADTLDNLSQKISAFKKNPSEIASLGLLSFTEKIYPKNPEKSKYAISGIENEEKFLRELIEFLKTHNIKVETTNDFVKVMNEITEYVKDKNIDIQNLTTIPQNT